MGALLMDVLLEVGPSAMGVLLAFCCSGFIADPDGPPLTQGLDLLLGQTVNC